MGEREDVRNVFFVLIIGKDEIALLDNNEMIIFLLV